MRYSTRFFIYSLLCGIASALLYAHPPIDFLYFIINIGGTSLTIKNLLILFGIFLVVQFFVIGIFVRSKEKR